MNYIQWCNDNNGFLTAVLSLIGLTLSATAIVVSIRTARLPYKKRIMLASYLARFQVVPVSVSNHPIPGIIAVATNVGNRTVNLTYLGYVVKKDGRYYALYPNPIRPHILKFNSKSSLAPSETSESWFYANELIESFSRENRNTELFVYAADTEGKAYMKKAGTVGRLLDSWVA